jgi:hypothetical protein
MAATWSGRVDPAAIGVVEGRSDGNVLGEGRSSGDRGRGELIRVARSARIWKVDHGCREEQDNACAQADQRVEGSRAGRRMAVERARRATWGASPLSPLSSLRLDRCPRWISGGRGAG